MCCVTSTATMQDSTCQILLAHSVAPHATGIYPGLRLPGDLAKLDALLRRDCRIIKLSMLLAGIGLVFDGVEGQWTLQAGDNRVLGVCGTGVSRRLRPCLRH